MSPVNRCRKHHLLTPSNTISLALTAEVTPFAEEGVVALISPPPSTSTLSALIATFPKETGEEVP